MMEHLTFFLVGQKDVGIQTLINKFIGESDECLEKNKQSLFDYTSAQIKIQNRNIELNLVNINSSDLSKYEGQKPSAVLFIYNEDEEETFEALKTCLQEVNKLFPKIKTVLVENNSSQNVFEPPSKEEIQEFQMEAEALFYRVNVNNLSSLENLFIETAKNVLHITGKNNIINNEHSKEIFPTIENQDDLTMILVGEKESEKYEIIKTFIDNEELSANFHLKL